jgi:hypothetical protein
MQLTNLNRGLYITDIIDYISIIWIDYMVFSPPRLWELGKRLGCGRAASESPAGGACGKSNLETSASGAESNSASCNTL